MQETYVSSQLYDACAPHGPRTEVLRREHQDDNAFRARGKRAWLYLLVYLHQYAAAAGNGICIPSCWQCHGDAGRDSLHCPMPCTAGGAASS